MGRRQRQARERAAQLGFVANGAARALSLRQFHAVGAVIPNIENEEFIRALSALQAGLRKGGYTLVLASAGYDLDDELHEAARMIERGIDGLLLVGDLHRPALFEQTARLSMPVVQAFTLSETRPCVGFDNAGAAGRAADQLAFGVLIEARAHGIDVPGQLSVIGFNDSDYAAYLNPPLTTVRVHASEIGRAAAEQLLARMAGSRRFAHPDSRRADPARQHGAPAQAAPP